MIRCFRIFGDLPLRPQGHKDQFFQTQTSRTFSYYLVASLAVAWGIVRCHGARALVQRLLSHRLCLAHHPIALVPPRDYLKRKCSNKLGGYSLLELLIVMAIIVLLAGMLGPPLASLLRSSNLSRSSEMIVGQLAQARQFALSKDRLVEVRFFQYCSPTTPGEAGLSPSLGRFRALQCFEISETGTATPLGRMQQLPDQVCIDSGAGLSSLIGGNSNTNTGTTLGMPIPQVAQAYNTVSFQFRPDGSINLNRLGKWFLTLHSTTDPDGLSVPPANFATILIDPANGSINTYRP